MTQNPFFWWTRKFDELKIPSANTDSPATPKKALPKKPIMQMESKKPSEEWEEDNEEEEEDKDK